VAAILAAAAYEDTLRRMVGGTGLEKKLATVIDDLKAAGILVAPQLGIAVSFLSALGRFRHGSSKPVLLTAAERRGIEATQHAAGRAARRTGHGSSGRAPSTRLGDGCRTGKGELSR